MIKSAIYVQFALGCFIPPKIMFQEIFNIEDKICETLK